MPRLLEAYSVQIRQYQARILNRGLTPRYAREAGRVLRRCVKMLEDGRMLVSSKKITQEHLFYIRNRIPIGRLGSQRNRKYIVELFRSFLKWTGNPIEPMSWPDQLPYRPRISREDYMDVLMAAYNAGDLRGATALLFFGLSARLKAAINAMPDDIQLTHVLLRDKGSSGEKQRMVPIREQEYQMFMQYLDMRAAQIREVLEKDPGAKIPDKLFIWTHGRAMGNVRPATMKRIIDRCGRRTGIHLSPHMIRRMAARELYMACRDTGEPVQTAMEITGHSDESTFRDYVGAIEENKAQLMSIVLAGREMEIPRKRWFSEIANK